MKDELGDRMKSYEHVFRTCLVRKIPVIVRVDGKAFHTFCKRFERPYDRFFNETMNAVMHKLCSNIQGAKIGERHSDEISILLMDVDKVTTEAYFDYQVQKMVSVVASMATAELSKQLVKDRLESDWKYLSVDEDWPMFDCRCFNLPTEEVPNYFWWRMLDAKRNSINMVAQSQFSHKALQGLTCNEMQEKLFQVHGINWNDLPQGQKAGFLCKKNVIPSVIERGPNVGQVFERNIWEVEPSPRSLHDLKELLYVCFV